MAHAAILAAVDGALHERDRRHRRPGSGIADDPGNFPGRVTPAAAAGFVGLLSLFNMVGRFFWAGTSDYIGRRNTYMVFFVLGILLYSPVPTLGAYRLDTAVRGVRSCVILSMYGGGFATIPAYLRDVFGTMESAQFTARLLTAWSVAGVSVRCW